jgi:hypothetical protein
MAHRNQVIVCMVEEEDNIINLINIINVHFSLITMYVF